MDNLDMSELINKINSMVNENSNSNDKSASGNSSISPETISKMVEMLNTKTNNNKENTSSNSTSSIDAQTILKFKDMFEKLNSKDDPRSNLLLALKPYLKESRKQKVEQYIQFFNVSKLLDELGPIAGGDMHK